MTEDGSMTPQRRALVMTIGVLVAALGLVGTVVLMSADTDGQTRDALGAFSWLTPLVAASVLGGAALALLGHRRPTRGENDTGPVVPCSSCQRDLLGDWRMCPYCGSVVGDRTSRRRVAES